MAVYQQINPGVPVKLMDALATTADTKGDWFALPTPKNGQQWVIAWQSYFDSAPGAISLQLQGAMNPVDAEAAILDTSTDVNGSMAHVAPIALRFIRARQVSKTGAVNTTVQVEIS